MPFPVDRAFIERAEQQLGRSLPKAFVQHLLSTNGGEVEAAGRTWMIHPVFDDSDRKRLRRTANHLVREAEAARRWCGFPQDALAIADGEGDRLVLLPDGDRFGDTVYRWDHETGELHVVAPTFAELAGPRFACPCCRFLTLGERGGFQICPVCFWEDDGQGDHDAESVRGGPNGTLSLAEARRNFAAFGACEERFKDRVRDPLPYEQGDTE